MATSNVILAVGATPRFVDIDPLTRNIDLNRIEAAITPATRAILPVDLAGLPVDRDQLYAIAARHRLRVIEDAAQAMGSRYRGRPVGSFGDLASFSFHPNKNITTIEGGCLVLNDEREARLAEQYRLQGVVRSGFDGMEGRGCRRQVQPHRRGSARRTRATAEARAFNARRAQLARRYFSAFEQSGAAEMGLQLPLADFDHSNWHMFQVVLPERPGLTRAQVMAQLHEAGIG